MEIPFVIVTCHALKTITEMSASRSMAEFLST